TERAKWNGLRKETSTRARSETAAILLIGHFTATLQELDAIAAEHQGELPVTATLASTLSPELAASLHLDESATIDLIVAERHPLRAMDDELLDSVRQLPCRCRVAHHLSLADPLLQQFSGEWVAGVLKSLGMTEDESIQSSMVSRRVKAAQKRIGLHCTGNEPARSAAEWLAKNMPPG
ncbi:MAG: hypothetical protein AB7K24_12400, partial [Gemmataceae bacterium]